MEAPRSRLWRNRASIFGLISASTAALLLCPCDCTSQNPRAILLIALSIALGGCAAVLIYREMRRRSDITAFLKAVSAIAIVVFGVYAEFTVAMDCIAWLARRGR
jgi:predicted membrane channel-forming protein YqfA (hemolysin III family)